MLYTQFLLATTSMNHPAIGMASVLPCFWIYKQVGDYIYQHYQPTHNPYFDWIQTYSVEAYGEAVAKAIRFADELASIEGERTAHKMIENFLIVSRMEYLFLDRAYAPEEWKI